MDMIFERLAAEYPQLYLNPNMDTQEAYRRVVLKGETPQTRDLSHYMGDAADKEETLDTPAGRVRVVTLGNRRDFELVLRSLMAAKDGQEKKIPESQGAAMLTVFNWPRIHEHLAQFPKEEQQAGFKSFTSVKENYTDMLVILSRGPYSNVDAEAVGMDAERWLSVSDTIRRFHELTHVICRRRYPDDVDAVRDELIADAVGIYAAYGYFDSELEKKFLGICGGEYTGGRLKDYTDAPEELTEEICVRLDEMKKVIDSHSDGDPFSLIPVLMRKQ